MKTLASSGIIRQQSRPQSTQRQFHINARMLGDELHRYAPRGSIAKNSRRNTRIRCCSFRLCTKLFLDRRTWAFCPVRSENAFLGDAFIRSEERRVGKECKSRMVAE